MAVAHSAHAIPAALTSAINAGDIEGALQLWAPDAILVPQSGAPIRGRAAIGEALEGIVASGASISIDLQTLTESQHAAIATGTLTLQSETPDGEIIAHSSDSIVVYSRAPEGEWQIAIDFPWGLPAPPHS